MTRRLPLVAAMLLVAGGCVTGPPFRPATDVPPAHLFDGCGLLPRASGTNGYDVKCGHFVASVRVLAGDRPVSKLMLGYLHGVDRAIGGDVEQGPVPGGMRVAGRHRPAILGIVHPPDEPKVDAWLGAVAAWHTGDGRSVVLACGGPGPGTAAGDANDQRDGLCSDLLDWMAVHPTPPPGLPAAKR